MTTPIRPILLSGLLATALTAGNALAAPGDIHRVSGAGLVNLRAGPAAATNVRDRLAEGDEVIELTRDDNWVGVRVLKNGQEGWIYGGLLDRVASSGLRDDLVIRDAGFMQYSESFDRLVRRINYQLGFPIVRAVEQTGEGALRVVPTTEWLVDGSRDAHVMTTVAVYQMWKNQQEDAPVAVTLTDLEGDDYITISDAADGPSLTITTP